MEETKAAIILFLFILFGGVMIVRHLPQIVDFCRTMGWL